ncbi:MAG: hypothetical protein WC891_02820 [Actinomycetota bacterium]
MIEKAITERYIGNSVAPIGSIMGYHTRNGTIHADVGKRPGKVTIRTFGLARDSAIDLDLTWKDAADFANELLELCKMAALKEKGAVE